MNELPKLGALTVIPFGPYPARHRPVPSPPGGVGPEMEHQVRAMMFNEPWL